MSEHRPQYTITVNRHDGPHNYVKIARPDETVLIAVTDRGISTAPDMTSDESKMVIRVLAEHCRNLYMIQEGR